MASCRSDRAADRRTQRLTGGLVSQGGVEQSHSAAHQHRIEVRPAQEHDLIGVHRGAVEVQAPSRPVRGQVTQLFTIPGVVDLQAHVLERFGQIVDPALLGGGGCGQQGDGGRGHAGSGDVFQDRGQ